MRMNKEEKQKYEWEFEDKDRGFIVCELQQRLFKVRLLTNTAGTQGICTE